MIEVLPDKMLLNIFRHFLEISPRHWPTLMHICRKWRHIVFVSHQTLQIRLFCTHGKPVLKTLDCWPELPIVVQYGGMPALHPPSPKDEDNIMAALNLSHRVTSIGLTVTRSLLKKLSAVERPFSELEELVLLGLSGKTRQLTLPSAFQWGLRLRRLYMTGVDFPSPFWLLQPSPNLVDLHIHQVYDYPHHSPEALTSALCGMVQLRSLSLDILRIAITDLRTPFPPSRERIILPYLTCFKFRGADTYLEALVTRMDTPRLGDIEVKFTQFDESDFRLLNIRKFTDRIGMHKSYRRADFLFAENASSLSLTRPGHPTRLKFQLSDSTLTGHGVVMDQICTHFSASLDSVEDLRISMSQEDRFTDWIQYWLQHIELFARAMWFHLDGCYDYTTNILHAMQQPEWRETVLPALYKLYIPQPGPNHAPSMEAVVSFMTSRRLSGKPIVVEYEGHIGEKRGTIQAQSHDH